MSRAKKPVTFNATVIDGVVHFVSRDVFDAVMKHWSGSVTVTIAPMLPTRRLRANAYYWGVVLTLMADESGYTPEDLHELMVLRHHSKIVTDPRTGEEVRIPVTTTKDTVEQFSAYIERVMVDGAELFGIVFPEPRPSEDYRKV